LNAAPHPIAVHGRMRDAAKRALTHQGHQIVTRKDDRERITVGRWQIGKIFDVTAHVVVVVLHQQYVDLLAFHGGTHGRPAALQLGGRDWRLQAFGKLLHSLLQLSFRSRAQRAPE